MSPIPNFEGSGESSHAFFDTNLISERTSSESIQLPDQNTMNYLNDNKTVETMEGKTYLDLDPAEEAYCEGERQHGDDEIDGSMNKYENYAMEAEDRLINKITQIANIDPDVCGMPLRIFCKVRMFNPHTERNIFRVQTKSFCCRD